MRPEQLEPRGPSERSYEARKAVGEKACEIAERVYGGKWTWSIDEDVHELVDEPVRPES